MTTPEYRIELLGSLRVLRDGQAQTHFRTHKTGAMLAYLAACPAHSARREELIELFWPDNDPASGRNCLRIALTALRQMLPLSPSASSPSSPACVLQADTRQVWLDPDGYTTDKADFEAALKEATRAQEDSARIEWLKRALDLYAGDLLPGYDEQPFQGERQRLADAQQLALRRLVALLVTAKDGAGALDYANRAVHADPLRVEAQRLLIQLYVGMGRQEAALRQYHTLERVMAEHFHTRPSSALRDLVAGMDATGRDGETSSRTLTASLPPAAPLSNNAPASPHAPRFAPAAPHRQGSLPTPLSQFFGQEDSLAAVLEMLDTPHTRLITLTGLGGSGKTRLAVQVGGTLRESLQDAVWFVPLAHLSDPGRILDAIAETLAPTRPSPAGSFDQIVHALGHAPTLLILDNFEHLAEQGARVIPPLLDALPGLIVLITSRHRLNLSGEYEYAVQPLPTPQAAGTPERLLEFASVQLFVDRARAARSEFRLTRENAQDVAALCRHLEGVPLAIELAAAYAQVLSPAQILARAARRLPLLVSRSKDANARHASLRAALDWSWQLLTPAQQRFFARLSVLRGGWTLDAAQSIGANACPPLAPVPSSPSDLPFSAAFPATSDPAALPAFPPSSAAYAPFWSHDAHPFGAFTDSAAFDAPFDASFDASFDNGTDALLMLADLRERSLIRGEDTGQEMRYEMLETLREFAGEQMDAPALTEARRSHSRYFLGLAEQGETYLTGPDASLWLKRLYADRDNLRAALRFLLDTQGATLVARPPHSTTPPEINTNSRDSSDADGSETAWAGLRLAGALWRYWYVRGYYDEGQEWLQKALALPAAQSAPADIRLKALRGLGNLALAQGHLDRAQQAFEAHRALADSGGSIRDRAAALGSLAHVLRERGDLDQARALREESLCLFRQDDDERGIALTLANLAVVMTAQGERAAIDIHRECLRLFRQLEDTQNVVLALNNLAIAALKHGDASEARDCLMESLSLSRSQENRRGFVSALSTLADLAAKRACLRQAAALFGCVEGLLQQINLPADSSLCVSFQQEREQVRAVLGKRDFDQHSSQAQMLTIEQIIEIARDIPT